MSQEGIPDSAKETISVVESDGTVVERLLVALRVRPLKKEEVMNGESQLVHVVDNKMVILVDPIDDRVGSMRQKRRQERQYVYDIAFDGDSHQADVYRKTTEPLIDMVMDGFNATVFAYGATGAGKTYTMVGTDKEPGIMIRALNDLFRRVTETSEELDFRVTMSYLEIYNEMIRDLLNPSSGYLELREDAKKVQVVGLTQVSTNSTNEVIKLLSKGNRARTMESTAANKTSSRSHALLEVVVKQQNRIRNTVDEIRSGKLYMIDLAGSERASNTKNRGKRLVEGAHINRSLLALGNCINALAEKGSKYVNYRDSKLTRLLKDALSGNCRTVMIAHISPASSNFDESRNTLVYADRAKNIRNKIHRNVMDVSYHMAQYQTIIDELRQEIHRLRTKINAGGAIKGQLSDGTDRKQSPEQVKRLKDELVKTFNEQMELRRLLMEIDTHVLALSIEFEKQSVVVGQWEMEKLKKAANSNDGTYTRDKNEDNEPSYIRRAWDELVFIQDEQQRYWDMRQEIDHQFRGCQAKVAKIEEDLPFRINSEEQRELLSLLCKVHELEIEKMEMQATALLKEHELRRKDMVIMRYDRQKNLSDEIISKQKAIIATLAHGDEGNKIECPPDLQDLYNQYRVETSEISNNYGNASSNKSTNIKNSSLLPGSRDSNRRTQHQGRHKLPRLKQERGKIATRRTLTSDNASQNRNTPPTRISGTAPNSTTVSLPPIDGQGTSSAPKSSPEHHQMKDGLRSINAVAARRRSIRTADATNMQETTLKHINGKTPARGSSVNRNQSNHANVSKGVGNTTLHKRRVLPVQKSSEIKPDLNSDIKVPDFGFAYPKPTIYYPPPLLPPPSTPPQSTTPTSPQIQQSTNNHALQVTEEPVAAI